MAFAPCMLVGVVVPHGLRICVSCWGGVAGVFWCSSIDGGRISKVWVIFPAVCRREGGIAQGFRCFLADRAESFLAPASACSCGRGLLTQVVHFLQRAWAIFPAASRGASSGARCSCSARPVLQFGMCILAQQLRFLVPRVCLFPQKGLRTWCFSPEKPPNMVFFPRKASERGATSTLLARRVFGPKLSDVAHWVVPGI